MAVNFKMVVHKNSENLHLKLAGDFDGSSAHELINMLKDNCSGSSQVFIHTSSLKSVDLFGRDVFLSGLKLVKRQLSFLVFTGEKASELVPENITNSIRNLCVTVH
jgi:anti-anti-sigma regulatory factor